VSTVQNSVTITVSGSNIQSGYTVDYYIKAVDHSDPATWTKTLEGTGVPGTIDVDLSNSTGSTSIETHLGNIGLSTTSDQTVDYLFYAKVYATGLVSGEQLVCTVEETLFDTVTYQTSQSLTTTLYAEADTQVDESSGSNFGSAWDLYCRDYGYEIWTLIQFNLSTITVEDVTLAKLKVYVSSVSANLDEAYIRRVTSTWDEYSVKWSSRPSVTTTNQVYSDTFDYKQWRSVTITALAEDWLENGMDNHGLCIYPAVPSMPHFFSVRSRDHSGSYAPKLYLEYTGFTASWAWIKLPPLSITSIIGVTQGQLLFFLVGLSIVFIMAVRKKKSGKRRR
jgi:hypothetical protein